ncbi:hypothetical protein E3P99_00208 [Wallemia hederae]|uniref:Uncharacterized protein n=1 Tax=Wallemia hederae TaxID=1540922 RepID=A0A4T0FY15_9BASI|nr:hypothetical protein E3P99_00208 [Wallemia hederae]
MNKSFILLVVALLAAIVSAQVGFKETTTTAKGKTAVDGSSAGASQRPIAESGKLSGSSISDEKETEVEEEEEDAESLSSTATATSTASNTHTTATSSPTHELSITEIVRNIDLNKNYTRALHSLSELNEQYSVKAEQVNPLLHQLNIVIDDASEQLGRFEYKNTTKINISELNNIIRYTDQKLQKEVGPAVTKADKQSTSQYQKQQLHTLNSTAAQLGDELRTSLPSIVYQQIMKLQ